MSNVRAMLQVIPQSSHYLKSSFVGSMFAALFHVFFGISFYEMHTKVAEFYLANHSLSERVFDQFLYQVGFVIIYGVFIFIIFLAVGYPLFLLLRKTPWFRSWIAIVLGATVGIFVAIYFNVPIFLGPDFPNYFWVCGANGALSAAVCCWFIHRSNLSVERVAAKSQRPTL